MNERPSLNDDPSSNERPKLSEAFGGTVPDHESAIDQYLLRVCKQHSDRIALVSMYQNSVDFNKSLPPSFLPVLGCSEGGYISWTHGQLLNVATALAHGLLASGVQPGYAIATMLPSGVEWVLFLYAAIILHCPLVPMNIRALSNGDIVRDAVKSSGAIVIVASETKIAAQLEDCFSRDLRAFKIKIVVDEGQNSATDSWMGLKAVFRSAIKAELPKPLPSMGPSDPALIMFTSGKLRNSCCTIEP